MISYRPYAALKQRKLVSLQKYQQSRSKNTSQLSHSHDQSLIKNKQSVQFYFPSIKYNHEHAHRAISSKFKSKQPSFSKHFATEVGEENLKECKVKDRFEIIGVAGQGTFGIVFCGVDRKTGKKIAIKKVLLNNRYKNREAQILKMLNHINAIKIIQVFRCNEQGKQYMNIIMDYYPENLFQIIQKNQLNNDLIKIFSFQIFKALNYLSTLSISHRDLKPHNILLSFHDKTLVITDFGSAKRIIPTEQNVSYICSRSYRAPELIFGSVSYTTQIDMWSAGCIIVQMINGLPPFRGESQLNQMLHIMMILGTPTVDEILKMNESYDLFEYQQIPQIKGKKWKDLLRIKDQTLIDLVDKTLQYSPISRLTPAQALMHPYFDQLRDQHRFQLLVSKYKLSHLYNFSQQQLKKFESGISPIPKWYNQREEQLKLKLKMDSFVINRLTRRMD